MSSLKNPRIYSGSIKEGRLFNSNTQPIELINKKYYKF